MDDVIRHATHQTGVQLTVAGQYAQAVDMLRLVRADLGTELLEPNQARQKALEVFLANVNRDLADALRRDPRLTPDQQIEQAVEVIAESIDLLMDYPDSVELASSLQHSARLDRQISRQYLIEAETKLAQAWSALQSRNHTSPAPRRNRVANLSSLPPAPEQLWIGLDYAGILALLGKVQLSARVALVCLQLAQNWNKDPRLDQVVNHSHVKRARLLLLSCWWPTCPLPIIRRAFYGRPN